MLPIYPLPQPHSQLTTLFSASKKTESGENFHNSHHPIAVSRQYPSFSPFTTNEQGEYVSSAGQISHLLTNQKFSPPCIKIFPLLLHLYHHYTNMSLLLPFKEKQNQKLPFLSQLLPSFPLLFISETPLGSCLYCCLPSLSSTLSWIPPN